MVSVSKSDSIFRSETKKRYVVNYSVDIRVVVKDELTIRIRDDCPSFDPKKYLEQFHPEDPTKNIGIRMIALKAKEMIYQNVAGINTLLVKV